MFAAVNGFDAAKCVLLISGRIRRMGMAIGNAYGSNKRRIELKKPDGTVVGTMSVSSPAKKAAKRLRYNFKQISSLIMMSKTANSAGKAVTRAKVKVAELLRKQRTGEYNENELKNAIIHAKKMERIARKRMRHLEQEEDVRHRQKDAEFQEIDQEELLDERKEIDAETEYSAEELHEMMRRLQEIMMQETQSSMEELTDETGLDELSEELTGGVRESIDPEELERLKKKHRSDELREIAEADMKYLRAFFNQLQKEKQELSGGSGVSLELGGVEMPVEQPSMPAVTEAGEIDLSV